VKTEKEFSIYFIDSCQQNTLFKNEITRLSITYWKDLTGHLHGYFSNEDRLLVTEKAAKMLAEQLLLQNFNTAWVNVIKNFTQNNNWGFTLTHKKPKLKKTEEQKIFSKLFKYVWAFFQSMIVLKIAVYYFGLESADRPDEISVVWVWLFFSISAGSLFFFAYRNRNDTD
jgi:hypothetical protein